MEIFFTDRENAIIREILDVDIIELNRELHYLEEIYNFKEYSSEVLSIIQKSGLRKYYRIISKKALIYLKKDNLPTYYLKSFDYYYSNEDKMYAELTRCGKISFDKYKNQLLAVECSLLNLLLNLIETKTDRYGKKNIAIFECCQIEKHPLDLMTEVKIIKDILLNSDIYYPIVRFSVNRKILKKTLESFLPDIIHFVCHGEKNGDLNFFNGDASGLKRFSPEYFEKIIGIFSDKKIEFIYFNSCYSDAFLNKIKSNGCSNYFLNGLGYVGENISYYAKQFAEAFYFNLSTNRNCCALTYANVYASFPYCKVTLDKGMTYFDYKSRLVFK